MKKAIYINCWTDPWIKVAEQIKEKYQVEPGYWVGYQEELKEETIKEAFKGVVYHSDHDAWCGRFPKQIEDHFEEEDIGIDFLRQNQEYELMALKMLDRVDPTLHSFSFPERQRHVRNLFRKWMCCLRMIKPEFVVTPMVPHRVYDYTLYVLCHHLGIPFIFFNHTPFNGRCIVMNEYFSIGNMFIEDYKKNLQNANVIGSVQEDVLKAFETNKKDYRTARPDYMVKNEAADKNWNTTWKILRHTLRRLFDERHNLRGENGRLKNWVYGPYYKESENIPIEKSRNTPMSYLRVNINGNKYIKELKKIYESLTVKPNYNEKYVILFLHYQPEATTCPIGNIFVDQELCVDVLLRNLPSDYFVYIKEHPSQFYAHSEGQMGRIKQTYFDLAKKPRVKLMSTNEVSFDLVEHCQALATVSGTVGWEGVVRGKPVIVFGMTWYENYDKGVLRITDDASAKKMKGFIDGYEYNEHSVLAYLASVSNNTVKAYFYKAVHKDKNLVTEQTCVDNLVNAIFSLV